MARGVNSELANSLREHLLQKERFQYVGWLKTMEEMLSKDH
jgi:complement component 1 Q subcomponent-binding protein